GLAGPGGSAVGMVPEAVVVVFDQVRTLEQRGMVAAGGLGGPPQRAGNAPPAQETGKAAPAHLAGNGPPPGRGSGVWCAYLVTGDGLNGKRSGWHDSSLSRMSWQARAPEPGRSALPTDALASDGQAGPRLAGSPQPGRLAPDLAGS